jgi:hypothetical protein
MLILKLLLFYLLSLPVSHLLLGRIIHLDYLSTEKKINRLKSIFYIPLFNIVVYLIYLLIVIGKFKRP